MSSHQEHESCGGNSHGVAQAVKEQIEPVTSAIRDTAKAAGQQVADAASTAAEKASCAWDSTRHTAEELGSQVADRAQTAHADAVIFIRSHPLTTVFSALGVGILLGAALTLGGSRR